MNNMTTVAATDLKNRFGKIMDMARREPVIVQSHGRDTVVILDHEEYERLQRLEDAFWIARAEESAKSGYLGHEETMRRIKERLAAIEAGESGRGP